MEQEHALSGCFPALMTPCSSTGAPVVVCTVAQNTAITLEHARHAKANGAQGLMNIPPSAFSWHLASPESNPNR